MFIEIPLNNTGALEIVERQKKRRKSKDSKNGGLPLDIFDTPKLLTPYINNELSEITALLLGGTNGVGEALATLIVLQGGKVIAVGFNNDVRFKVMKANILLAGGDIARLTTSKTNITNPDDMAILIDDIKKKFGYINLLGPYAAKGAISGKFEEARAMIYNTTLENFNQVSNAGILSPQGTDFIYQASGPSIRFKEQPEITDVPDLKGWAEFYSPVARAKDMIQDRLYNMFPQNNLSNVRLITMVAEIIPHTTTIDLVQTKLGLSIVQKLIDTFGESSRLEVALTTIGAIKNRSLPSRSLVRVNMNPNRRV